MPDNVPLFGLKMDTKEELVSLLRPEGWIWTFDKKNVLPRRKRYSGEEFWWLFLIIVISVHKNTYRYVDHPKSDSRPSRRIGGFETIKAEGVGCSSAYSSDSLGECPHGNRATIEKDF